MPETTQKSGFLTSVLPAVLGGVGSIITQGLQRKQQEQNNKDTLAMNRQMADYEYSQNLAMWNKGNVYNSPSEQMKRLKEAGLNPAMVYGTGTVSGNSAQALPKYQAPTANLSVPAPINVTETLGNFMNLKLQTAQLNNLEIENASRLFELSKGRMNQPYETATKANQAIESASKMHTAQYQSDITRANAQKIEQILSAKLDNLYMNTINTGYGATGKDISNKFMESNLMVNMLTKIMGGFGIGGILTKKFGGK